MDSSALNNLLDSLLSEDELEQYEIYLDMLQRAYESGALEAAYNSSNFASEVETASLQLKDVTNASSMAQEALFGGRQFISEYASSDGAELHRMFAGDAEYPNGFEMVVYGRGLQTGSVVDNCAYDRISFRFPAQDDRDPVVLDVATSIEVVDGWYQTFGLGDVKATVGDYQIQIDSSLFLNGSMEVDASRIVVGMDFLDLTELDSNQDGSADLIELLDYFGLDVGDYSDQIDANLVRFDTLISESSTALKNIYIGADDMASMNQVLMLADLASNLEPEMLQAWL
ncbi:MAG: hypothetical protein VW437_05015 [Betaproteobacteria bacterium]